MDEDVCIRTGRLFDTLTAAFTQSPEPLISVVEIIHTLEKQEPMLIEALLGHAMEHADVPTVISDAAQLLEYVVSGEYPDEKETDEPVAPTEGI